MSYFDELKHPKWQQKRLQIMSRAGFMCEECGSGEKTLHVHHKAYEKGCKPWEYPDSNLICLCDDCHSKTHHLDNEIKVILADLNQTQKLAMYFFALHISSGGDQ